MITEQSLINVTEKAAQRARALLEQESSDLALRVFVVAGGCTGFQYGMALDDTHDDDFIVSAYGVKVAVDPNSAPYLAGSEIDYIEDIMKSGFSIHNPNATKSCACGSSFRTADDRGAPDPCTT